MERLNQRNGESAKTLFALSGKFHIVELGREDARVWNPHVHHLKQLVTASQEMYPGIELWFRDKVIPGLKSSERIAYVAYENDKPIASAVLKIGRRAKLCHL